MKLRPEMNIQREKKRCYRRLYKWVNRENETILKTIHANADQLTAVGQRTVLEQGAG